jgi:hypothetical protein
MAPLAQGTLDLGMAASIRRTSRASVRVRADGAAFADTAVSQRDDPADRAGGPWSGWRMRILAKRAGAPLLEAVAASRSWG